jgi:hypothetical protein
MGRCVLPLLLALCCAALRLCGGAAPRRHQHRLLIISRRAGTFPAQTTTMHTSMHLV